MFLCCSTGDPILSALACVFTFSVTCGLHKVQDSVCHISTPAHLPSFWKGATDWLLIMTEDTNHHPVPMSGAQTLKATGSLNRFNFPSCKCCLYWLTPEDLFLTWFLGPLCLEQPVQQGEESFLSIKILWKMISKMGWDYRWGWQLPVPSQEVICEITSRLLYTFQSNWDNYYNNLWLVLLPSIPPPWETALYTLLATSCFTSQKSKMASPCLTLDSMAIKSKDSGNLSDRPESQLQHLLTMWVWASYFKFSGTQFSHP